MKHKILLLLATMVLAVTVRSEDKKELKSQREKISYSFGMNVANSLRSWEVELDYEVFLQAVKDVMGNKTTLMNDQEARQVMNAYRTEQTAKQQAKRKEQGEKNKAEGEKFLAENKTKPGVITLPSGLQYKVLTEGNGPIPKTNDTVNVNYRGTLIDGTEFDSSFKRNQPASFNVGFVIKGWTEALSMMKTGSKWQLFVPSSLAYGDQGSGKLIGPGSTLIFETELLSIKPAVQDNVNQPVTSDIIKVPSAEELKKGAKIEVIKPDQLPKVEPKK